MYVCYTGGLGNYNQQCTHYPILIYQGVHCFTNVCYHPPVPPSCKGIRQYVVISPESSRCYYPCNCTYICICTYWRIRPQPNKLCFGREEKSKFAVVPISYILQLSFGSSIFDYRCTSSCRICSIQCFYTVYRRFGGLWPTMYPCYMENVWSCDQ